MSKYKQAVRDEFRLLWEELSWEEYVGLGYPVRFNVKLRFNVKQEIRNLKRKMEMVEKFLGVEEHHISAETKYVKKSPKN